MTTNQPSYYFKFAYTTITNRYSFDTNISMADFIDLIKSKIYVDFDVNNELIVEIVEAGLNTSNYESEMAPAVVSSDISFKNYYVNRNTENLAFYIRLKTKNGNIVQHLENIVG
jgi:hypothetical protein